MVRSNQYCPTCMKLSRYECEAEVSVLIDHEYQDNLFIICKCECGTRFIVDIDSAEEDIE